MNQVILTQLSLEELRQMLREELGVFLSHINMPTDPSSSPSKELLTVEQASIYLNLAHSTLYNLVHRREIPYMKRSRKLYFSKDELRKWVEEGRKPTQEVLKAAAQAHLDQLKKR
jgi:excisionase family DNA binding protein